MTRTWIPRAVWLLIGALLLLAAPALADREDGGPCGERDPGVQCGPGHGRTTAGGNGTGKVPHTDGAGHGWPAITGILWKVLDSGDRTRTGGPGADELLGHHGDETLSGGPGDDVIWGDWDPSGNSSRQHDTLIGGAGNDWLYPSHGRTSVRGGPGRDFVWAFYGKGRIDCGPGRDTVRIRTTGAFTTRNCERILHFCSSGSNPDGSCRKPGAARGRRGSGAS